MSGTPNDLCRLPRVGALSTVRLPLGGQQRIALGNLVNAGLTVPLGSALVVSCLLPTNIILITSHGNVSANLPIGITRLEVASEASAVFVTSLGASVLWIEDYREK